MSRDVAAAVLVAVVAGVALGIAAVAAYEREGGAIDGVRGIDVSHHQGEIDWERVAVADVAFAFIKATEGADHRDSLFERNWSASRDVGLLRGAYHFFTFCTPGRPQARNFVDAISADARSLPPAVDVEFAGNCTTWDRDGDIRAVRRALREFLDEVERATGHRPILYVTDESYRRIVRGHFDEWPLWFRSLFRRPPVAPETGWLVWQYADRGRLDGIAGFVDFNVYAGTRDDLLAAAGPGRDTVAALAVRDGRLGVGPVMLGMTVAEARRALGGLEAAPVEHEIGCSGLEAVLRIAGREARLTFATLDGGEPELAVIAVREPLDLEPRRARLLEAVPALRYRPSRHDPDLAEADNRKPMYALPGSSTDVVLLDPSGMLWVSRLECLD